MNALDGVDHLTDLEVCGRAQLREGDVTRHGLRVVEKRDDRAHRLVEIDVEADVEANWHPSILGLDEWLRE